MYQPRKVDENITVAPQIAPEDLAAIAEEGFRVVVNNRPDGEEGAQPNSGDIRAAAERAGLRYEFIPVTHAGFSGNQVEAMAEVLRRAEGPVLAFCRSGTRSAHLWALAAASEGGDPAVLTTRAAAAGYDISAIRPLLDTLSGQP